MIEITDNAIDETAVLESVRSGDAGAMLLFVGTTRRFTGGLETEKLVYDCYKEMAIKVLHQLKTEAMEKWPIVNCSMVHRVGTVPLGQSSIAVAVSSPHRKDAFEAGQWLMDRVKEKLPVWKQENWKDGTREWIHPGVSQSDPVERG